MVNDNSLLRSEERFALDQLAKEPDIDGQRAAALLALDEGKTQAAAAEESGLTINQVRYILKKFREERLLAFPDAIGLLPAEEDMQEEKDLSKKETRVSEVEAKRLNRLLADVDDLVNELKATLPDAGQYPYSPLKMLTLVRDTAARYTPEIQTSLLEPFEDMTRDDLVDPETWKGIAYMIAYSAQFQASQAKGVLNERLPEPIKPDTVAGSLRGGLDRITPEMVRDLMANLEGTSREDLLDPETWKGLAYMLAYSAQFQAGKTKDMLNEQLPDPLKPATLWGMFTGGIDRITPETAKEILASFEGATKDDLLDPETWKGVWYMLNYSLQFQAEQLRQRLSGEPEEADESD
jgi:transposase-like protein